MKRIGLYIIIVLIITGCGKRHDYFTDKIEPVEIEILRFDNSLLNVSEETAMQDVRLLYDQYADFMPVFVEDILGIPVADTAYLISALPQFLNDTLYGFRATNQREKELFSDISDIEKSLNQAFAKTHYLYPDWPLPTIYFIVSGFNASIFFMGNDIVVGCDMYLGSDYEYYNRVVYDYQKYTMRKECIPADVVSAYLFRNIPYTSKENRLIDNMIYRGKIMYLLSVIMSDEKDYEVMGYSKEQWRWCEKYERQIWNTIMDKRDLFKTESLVLTSYLNDGPFTSEISQDSPARLGTWIGWRIVEAYMNNNPRISIQELMADGNAMGILELSHYKP